MSLNVSSHEKLLEAWGDAKTYHALHQEDWQMKMHSSSSTVSLSDMTDRWNIVFKNADIQNIRKFSRMRTFSSGILWLIIQTVPRIQQFM